MVYSEVVKAGLILPRKEKYTMRDVNAVMVNSLFNSFQGRTIVKLEAVFIVKCSAAFHDTDFSASVDTYRERII